MKKQSFKACLRKLFACSIAMLAITNSVTPLYAQEPLKAEVAATTTLRNVMYYGDWSIWGGQSNFYPQDIPADQLTHLNFAFLDFDSNGNLVFTDKDAAVDAPLGQAGVTWGDINAGILPAFQQLRAQNPNLKIGVSVGGWSKSADFPVVAADPVKRANLVDQLLKFITYTNMDFIDLDWEFPGHVRQPDLVDNKNDEGNPYASEADTDLFVTLLQDIRTALDKQGLELGKTYELSIAIHPSIEKLDMGVDIDRVFDIVDFANIMSYDMRGAWDTTSGHQSGLYSNPNDPLLGKGLSIDESVQYLLSQGAEASKIVIGAAYYTRGWESVTSGTDANNPGLFGDAAQITKDADQTLSYGAKNEMPLTNGDGGRMSGIWSYRNLDKLKAAYPGLKEYWDDVAKAPYLYDATSGAFFTYDNVQSIQEKANYVLEHGLGGMIAWMASNDKPTTSTKRDELTKATKEALFGSEDLTAHEIIYADLDLSIEVATYKESWGSNGGYTFTFKNLESLTESNSVLQAVEKTAETVKLPKFYIYHDAGTLVAGDYKAGTVTNKPGVTIVDLSNIYDAKNLVPGTTYTFTLRAQSAPDTTKAIESITLTQRMNKDGVELNKQVLYGEKEQETVNQAPVLSGVNNQSLQVGDVFDPLANVSAYDKEDGDLTAKISVEGSVDTSVAGLYSLTYRVEDSQGLATTKTIRVTVTALPTEDSEADFGVGQGIVWPEQVNAPFADMSAWNSGAFSNNGALNLLKVYEDTGVKFFNLGFIQALGGTSDGILNWGWGGYSVLNEQNADNLQYQGIKQAIKDIRAVGGDVAISLGGLNGLALWEATSDVEVLYQTYKQIVEGYGLTRLDLDIEGAATNKEHNKINAQAIKKLQDATGVDIVLTLAVLPSGLTNVQLDVLEVYLAAGVDVKLVNIMTMCYGNATLLPNENYGTASLRAVESTMKQVQDYFKTYANITLTESQAYAKIGTTPSVGFEGSAHPIFTKEWTKLVVDHAIEKGLGMTSMWSINRDAMAQDNSGIYAPYEHTKIMQTFMTGEDNGGGEEQPKPNTAPTLHGLKDQTIIVGTAFDPMLGVSASDKEDGDLTKNITVTGSVNSSVVGVYPVTYSVVDSQGLETTKTIKVTVKEVVESEDTFDPTKVYYGGEIVIYQGNEYKAKWWTQGGTPDTSDAWEKIVVPNPDGSLDWYQGMVCVGGDVVSYNGQQYVAKWWTTSTPGSDDSWSLK
ncbi:MAG: glycosyl hydrolase family 18 protein [Erysipelotrichaceae bacterium]